MQFTGEARYGDWIERLLYNAIGAALPVTERGSNFYYSDYRVGGGMKVYNWDTYTCLSGTYIQNLADVPQPDLLPRSSRVVRQPLRAFRSDMEGCVRPGHHSSGHAISRTPTRRN